MTSEQTNNNLTASGWQRLFRFSGNDFPSSLTAEERSYGRRLFARFYTLNGISVACLMHNILVLYAIRNGLSDSLVAVMASFIHLTMPFMILGKPVIARFGAARTRGIGWFMRYVSASIMVLAPFAASFSSQTVVAGLILTGAFGFAAFRSIGSAAISPLWGEVAEPEERGRFISTTQVRSQTAYFVTMALVITGFRYIDELWLYQLILGVGCAVGFYASTLTLLIPESSAPSRSARQSYINILRLTWRKSTNRRLVVAWCAGNAAYAIVIPFMMITVKNGYKVSDFTALTLGLAMVLGAVASSFLNRKIADLVGPRPLLIIYIIGLIAAAGFWSLAPSGFPAVPAAATFFLVGCCEIGIRVGLNQHFLAVVSDHDRVGISLLVRIISGAAAGVAGSVLGGGLLRILASTELEPFDVYRRYFLVISAVLLILLIATSRIEADNE